MNIDGSLKVVSKGKTNMADYFFAGLRYNLFQLDGYDYGQAFFALGQNPWGSWNQFLKSRSEDGITNSPVMDGDDIGRIAFYGDDGTYLSHGAAITVTVDGEPGTEWVASKLILDVQTADEWDYVDMLILDTEGVTCGRTLHAPDAQFTDGATENYVWTCLDEFGNGGWVELPTPNTGFTTQVISGNTTASDKGFYVLTASLELTLPATPTDGMEVGFSNRSNTMTCKLMRNGSKIHGVAEDLTIDKLDYGATARYIDSTHGWILY